MPTWKYLQRRCFNGPGWCPLCKLALESTTHLFLDCPFSKTTWVEAQNSGFFNSNWCGPQPEATLLVWTNNQDTLSIRALPCIVIWGIWLAQNKVIFQDKWTPPSIVAAQSLGILHFFPRSIEKGGPRILRDIGIDKSFPWAFFDGASQGTPSRCGGGATLHLSCMHLYTLSAGFGLGSNNYVELMALKLLILFAVEKNIKKIQIFGDSLIIMNWANKLQICHVMRLIPILEDIHRLITLFNDISFKHVFRELNKQADGFSKEVAQLLQGTWLIEDHKETDSYGYYHRPYHEV